MGEQISPHRPSPLHPCASLSLCLYRRSQCDIELERRCDIPLHETHKGCDQL